MSEANKGSNKGKVSKTLDVVGPVPSTLPDIQKIFNVSERMNIGHISVVQSICLYIQWPTYIP